MADRYRIVQEGGHYRVIDHLGKPKSGLVNIKALAEIKVDELTRKDAQKTRVCIAHGCTATFESEGPHHRMCNRHRAMVDDCGIHQNTGRRVRFRSS